MRLSTRDLNSQGSLSKSPSIHVSQLHVDVLCTSGDAWPPLLPSFSKDAVEAVNRFVHGFICKRIEYRCGQLSAGDYEESFLPRWVRMAEHRIALMEDFFAQHGSRLSEETFCHLFGAFEKVQSALRDARQELGDALVQRQDKRISFARPVAHRLIRRSRDRFSLRSVADVDEGIDLSRPSASPCPGTTADVWRDPMHSNTSSPLPSEQMLSSIHLAGIADSDDMVTFVLPVEEDTDEDHFTGRASGVYYGDIFHTARSSASRLSSDGGQSSVPMMSGVAVSKDSHENDVVSVESLLRACSGPMRRATLWRQLWIRCFYYCILPIAATLFIAAYFWGTLPFDLRLSVSRAWSF